jgi:hypothetical protein
MLPLSQIKESSTAILIRASTTRRGRRDRGHTISKQWGSAHSVANGDEELRDDACTRRQCMRSCCTDGARIQQEGHEGPMIHRERHSYHRQHIALHVGPKRQRRHGRSEDMTRLLSNGDGRAVTDVMANVAPNGAQPQTLDLRHPGAPSCGRNDNTADRRQEQGQRIPRAGATIGA